MTASKCPRHPRCFAQIIDDCLSDFLVARVNHEFRATGNATCCAESSLVRTQMAVRSIIRLALVFCNLQLAPVAALRTTPAHSLRVQSSPLPRLTHRLAAASRVLLCAGVVHTPTPPLAPPLPPLPLPRFSWRTVFYFVANPLVMLPVAALLTWVAPGLNFASWLGSAFAVSVETTRAGILVAAPMLLLSLVADELIPALKEVTQASRVITLYAFGSRLLPLRASIGAALISTAAALAEELAFRGTLQTGLAALGTAVALPPALAAALAVLVQALVFGRLHSYTDSPVYAVAATVAGLVFGGAFALTQNLWVPIVTHFVVDLVSFLVCHVQVAALDEAEQLALVETDVPIATALRLTLGPRPAAPAKPTAGELPVEP